MYRTNAEENSGMILKPFIAADSASMDSQEFHRVILALHRHLTDSIAAIDIELDALFFS